MDIDLTGKRILITGASGNLGSVMATTMAKCGADIIAHYFKNKSSALKVKNSIESIGRKCYLVQGDITINKDVIAMKKEIEKKFGLPEIIVNNAIKQNKWGTIITQDIETYLDQFNTSVIHNILMIKSFVPQMIEKKYGRIISINTECVMQNNVNSSAYVVGKRGMDGLLRILAKEIGEHNITVNQIAPGWIITEDERKNNTVDQPEYYSKIPLKRRGTDQEIANVVAFIASDLASFITGAFIPVCGGNIMPGI